MKKLFVLLRCIHVWGSFLWKVESFMGQRNVVMEQRNVFGTYNNSTYKVAYTAQVFESIKQSNFLERIWRGKTAHESLQSANFQNYPVFLIKPNQSNNLLILLVIFIDKAITYKVAYMTQVFQLKVIRRTKLRTWHKSLIQSINKLIYQSTKQTINQSINQSMNRHDTKKHEWVCPNTWNEDCCMETDRKWS